MGWLEHEGVRVPCEYVDVQGSAALLDENRRRFDLDSVAKDAGVEGKDQEGLNEAAKIWGTNSYTSDMSIVPHPPRAHLKELFVSSFNVYE